ncbi:hypothetical protein SNE40_005963 [Patella caerulea]|uniref:ZMYM2-like/QRICH1 C-terminal domain-containing protein n=1 Tax=Patella caerulea TaxID=87958 RepID=A0AAN8K6H1_PATCE
MKHISRKGIGSTTKKAAAFSDEEIDKLWQSKHYADYNAKVLVRTILFLNGLNFGLRGGQEHRNLRYRPSQITLHEPQGQSAYLQYTEDYSKSVQGGLKHRRVTKKSVTHHGNPQTERYDIGAT